MKLQPTRSVWLLLVVGLAFGAVSRTTGAGWLVVLVAVVASLLIVGVAGPILAVRRVVVDISGPHDATSGVEAELELSVGRGAVVLHLTDFLTEVGVVGPASGTAAFTPPYRGVLTTLAVTVRSGAPFGLAWARRHVTIELPHPIVVSPAPRSPDVIEGADHAVDFDGQPIAGDANDGTVASLVEYRPGDPMRRIHWSATARHGDLLVKQLEPPAMRKLVVVAELSGDEDTQEDIAGRALGLVRRELATGAPVELWTKTRSGVVQQVIATSLQAGRQLANSVPGVVPRRADDSIHIVVVAA